jgi:nuclear receptor coactivator 2
MQNMESLLNNTVAPNVSLQRSTNIVTDSQLSPGFPQGLISQLSPNQRGAPFSPQPAQGRHTHTLFTQKKNPLIVCHCPPGYQQSPYNTNAGQRLSPQQQQMVGGANFQPSPSSNSSNPQLSPRQPPFSQVPSQSQQSPASAQQWNATNARHGMQAQQNPMMNAQLSVIVWLGVF